MSVKVADVILAIRSRLGDEDSTSYRYVEPEIIDAVNSALAHLSEELLCFSRTWIIPCLDKVNRYELPSDFLRPISVNYNGVLAKDILSMEVFMSNDRFSLDTIPNKTVAYDMQTLHLLSFSNIKKGDLLELYYHCYENIDNSNDTVGLPALAKEALVYFALHLLFQKPVASKGLEKSNYYFGLYERELFKLRSRVRKNQQSKNIRSSFTRV